MSIFKPRRYGSFSERLRGLARIGWFCGGLAAILLVADHLSLAPSGPAVEIVQERAAAPADGDQATTEALSAGLAEAARSSDNPREQATSADTVARDAAEAMALPPRPLQQVVAVRRGDTLMDILLTLGISRAEAHEAVSALSTS